MPQIPSISVKYEDLVERSFFFKSDRQTLKAIRLESSLRMYIYIVVYDVVASG